MTRGLSKSPRRSCPRSPSARCSRWPRDPWSLSRSPKGALIRALKTRLSKTAADQALFWGRRLRIDLSVLGYKLGSVVSAGLRPPTTLLRPMMLPRILAMRVLFPSLLCRGDLWQTRFLRSVSPSSSRLRDSGLSTSILPSPRKQQYLLSLMICSMYRSYLTLYT
ncbi:hypothetical protein K523DRAFT_420276 [Schizophyllum commune Tattone D]|nr:hypothetical protein K523DRAFT_420276 [Schizophyllum commune Tattone D]